MFKYNCILHPDTAYHYCKLPAFLSSFGFRTGTQRLLLLKALILCLVTTTGSKCGTSAFALLLSSLLWVRMLLDSVGTLIT